MKPDEIVAILNQNKHDGETDWEYRERGYVVIVPHYHSPVQHRKFYSGGGSTGLSSASAEIIARHYLQTAALAEQDRRIHAQVTE